MGCFTSTSALEITTYDKRAKRDVLNPLYSHIKPAFEEIASLLTKDHDPDLTILDIGTGAGTHLPILSSTFLSNNSTLICIDPSPKCLQLSRQKTDKHKDLKDQNIKFIQNTSQSLCLTSQYNSSIIDICFMTFVLQYISSKNKARDTILNEIYECLKPNGLFVIFESSKQFMGENENQMLTQNSSGNADDTDSDEEWNDNIMDNFNDLVDLQQYIESFGFKLSKQILQNELEKHW
eukprot:831468_1